MRKVLSSVLILLFLFASASFAAVPKEIKLKDLPPEYREQLMKPKTPVTKQSVRQKILDQQKTTAKTKSLAPSLELGYSLGLIAGIPAAKVELIWNRLFSVKNLRAKSGVMYAQGEDANKTTRKNALIFLDGVWEIQPAEVGEVGTYLGGGINYLVYTSGRVSGISGGEVYFGLQNRYGKKEILYLELGYSAIRTGFSPAFKGVNATIGLRSNL